MIMLYSFLSVALGGAIGAVLRYAIGLAMTSTAIGLPAFVATLTVNVVGCALMGLMAALIQSYPEFAQGGRPFVSSVMMPFIMTGFLGALTTFSSFTLDAFTLLEKQHYGTLGLYMMASFALSLTAFFAIYHLTKTGLS